MKCKDCKWWDGQLFEDGEGIGKCHRKAPLPKYIEMGICVDGVEQGIEIFRIAWPDVMSDYWCGEFEDKE